MAVDDPLERLLEDLDSARRRLETRTAMIKEALDQLPHADAVNLENYLGYGRTLPLTDAVRDALRTAAMEEIERMKGEVEDIRQRVIARRLALAELPQ